MILAVIIILGILSIFFKITYAVTLDGVEIGYTSDKNALQERINGYIQTGDGSNLAFILVDHMPEYHLCFVCVCRTNLFIFLQRGLRLW